MSKKTTRQKMQNASTVEIRWTIFNEWVSKWQNEQRWLLRCLDEAIGNHNHDKITIYCGQLRAITKKKFTALYNMLPLLELEIPDWLEDWKRNQSTVVNKLGAAAYADAHEKIDDLISEMRKLTSKGFSSLKKVNNKSR